MVWRVSRIANLPVDVNTNQVITRAIQGTPALLAIPAVL